MDANEAAVKAKWPDAWVTPKSAQNGPFGRECWVWHDEKPVPRDYRPLGRGATQSEAWADAAPHLQPVADEGLRKAVQDVIDQILPCERMRGTGNYACRWCYAFAGDPKQVHHSATCAFNNLKAALSVPSEQVGEPPTAAQQKPQRSGTMDDEVRRPEPCGTYHHPHNTPMEPLSNYDAATQPDGTERRARAASESKAQPNDKVPEIPKDLQKDYERGGKASINSVTMIANCLWIRGLIERIARLEDENAALTVKLGRLTAPVSDEELVPYTPYSAIGTTGLMLVASKDVTAMIAARAEDGGRADAV